jgi:rhodanese-related sulfurtransferase
MQELRDKLLAWGAVFRVVADRLDSVAHPVNDTDKFDADVSAVRYASPVRSAAVDTALDIVVHCQRGHRPVDAEFVGRLAGVIHVGRE